MKAYIAASGEDAPGWAHRGQRHEQQPAARAERARQHRERGAGNRLSVAFSRDSLSGVLPLPGVGGARVRTSSVSAGAGAAAGDSDASVRSRSGSRPTSSAGAGAGSGPSPSSMPAGAAAPTPLMQSESTRNSGEGGPGSDVEAGKDASKGPSGVDETAPNLQVPTGSPSNARKLRKAKSRDCVIM